MPTETIQTVENIRIPSSEFIFGSTAGMRGIREQIERACHDDLPVLIEGESGTGKELIGRFLHSYSRRRKGPFLKLNCAALPGSLEGAIYGCESGARAKVRDTCSSIGLASGGTLFFDEIGDMDLTLQWKLAETLACGHYRLCDGSEDRAVDARIVCSSSVDLNTGLLQGCFLERLLKSFAHYHLQLLPLRERKEDIPQLCEHLLGKFAREFGRSVPRLSANALEALQRWRWPGNIRELENWIARIVIFGAEEVIGLQFSRQLLARQEPEPAMSGEAARRHEGHMKRSRRHN
jgi:DNA-binding NtrC family response regulator